MRGSLNLRSRNAASKISIVILLALAGGCGGAKAVPERRPVSGTLREFVSAHEATFQPSRYDPPLDTLQTENSAFDVSRPVVEFATPVIEDTIPGFRVQLILTQDIDHAASVRQAVTRYLPGEWVYIVYDLPYYKVRVGNYAERESANLSVRRLIDLGYPDAWVVPDKILRNPPPPSPPDSSGK